jgi:hypothetical protein
MANQNDGHLLTLTEHYFDEVVNVVGDCSGPEDSRPLVAPSVVGQYVHRFEAPSQSAKRRRPVKTPVDANDRGLRLGNSVLGERESPRQ